MGQKKKAYVEFTVTAWLKRSKSTLIVRKTNTRRNNSREDKGGRGDKLSPQGILNHFGFNTPPQLVLESECSGRSRGGRG